MTTLPIAAPGAAHRLAALAGDLLGGPLPVRLRCWDGSEAGPSEAARRRPGRPGLREHYVRAVAAWHRTLEERWRDAVALVGEESARMWRLCPTGGALAFEEGRTGADQILAVRRTDTGAAAVPGTPADRYTLLDRP